MPHDNIYYKWTESAIECYKRGCSCEDCPVKETMETPCRMKHTVMIIVKNIGAPLEKQQMNIFENLSAIQNEIINAILLGAKTKTEISKVVNISTTSVQNHLSIIYNITSLQGIQYKRKSNRLKELVEFLEKSQKYAKNTIDINERIKI